MSRWVLSLRVYLERQDSALCIHRKRSRVLAVAGHDNQLNRSIEDSLLTTQRRRFPVKRSDSARDAAALIEHEVDIWYGGDNSRPTWHRVTNGFKSISLRDNATS